MSQFVQLLVRESTTSRLSQCLFTKFQHVAFPDAPCFEGRSWKNDSQGIANASQQDFHLCDIITRYNALDNLPRRKAGTSQGNRGDVKVTVLFERA